MNYKLYKEVLPWLTPREQILYNRGIAVQNQEKWIKAGWESINQWHLLDNMTKATERVKKAIDNKEFVQVVVDSDVDGFTSAAIFINYLFDIDKEYTEKHIDYILHEGKQHGLADVIDLIHGKTTLVICPDAASNDIELHKMLKDKNIDVICLDHHEASKHSNDYAITVNPQICDYPNKAITGAGVTWQFCRAFDELYNHNYANKFIDLCAIGNCGDMANYQENEIRAFMNLGLSNITNGFMKTMAEKNDYSIQKMNGINYYSCAFYIVPFVNACVRSGTMEEKNIVFSSMLNQNMQKQVLTSKKGHKGEYVPLYEEAVLVAERVKRRQTKVQDETMDLFDKKIEEENLLDNAIILLLCEPGEVDKNVAGLIANKIQAKYQKPCAVLTETSDGQSYTGSMRNYSRSEISDLKKELEKTQKIEFCAGHANAGGLGISKFNIKPFLAKFNEQYKNIDQTPVYWVDYIWDKNTIDSKAILDIGRLNIYGQEIPESYICLEDIPITSDMITLMSPDKNPTLKIQIGKVSVIKFKSSQKEYEDFCSGNILFTAICKCNVNAWNGRISPQLMVEDFTIREEWIF